MNRKKNVYLPHKSEKLIQLASAASTPDDDCSFLSSILNSYVGDKKKKGNQLTNLTKAIEEPKIQISPRKPKQVNTWENLAGDDIPVKSFSSETSFPIQLRLSAANSRNPVEIKTIPFDKLLNDLKLLTIGIESASFKCRLLTGS